MSQQSLSTPVAIYRRKHRPRIATYLDYFTMLKSLVALTSGSGSQVAGVDPQVVGDLAGHPVHGLPGGHEGAAATVGTAVVASLAGRRAGRDSARALLGAQRADRIDDQIRRRGLWAVVGQRFVPGLSDALAAYAFGAFGVPLWQMAVGAFIGSVPRAFVYTALGASIGDLSAPLAYTAIAVWCVTAVIGAFAVVVGLLIWFNFVCQVILIGAAWVVVSATDQGVPLDPVGDRERRQAEARLRLEIEEQVRAEYEASRPRAVRWLARRRRRT